MRVTHPIHLLMPLLAACAASPNRYALSSLPESETTNGQVELRATVELVEQPLQGWDLVLDLSLLSSGRSRPMVVLSRTLLRSDGLRWQPCHLPPGDDPDTLRLRLYEEDSLRMVLRCQQIQRPERRLEIRVPISGAGGKGYVDLVFGGLSSSYDPDNWELD